MKRSTVILAVVTAAAVVAATVFAVLYFSDDSDSESEPATETSSVLPQPPAPPSGGVLLGTIKSLTAAGDQYELRFDPVVLTSGVTANVAKAEDEGVSCEPIACPPVENDNYIVDDGHQLLTYLVPEDAQVTVLSAGVDFAEISVSELAQLVKGESVGEIPPLPSSGSTFATGFWIEVDVDTVRSLVQQYRP